MADMWSRKLTFCGHVSDFGNFSDKNNASLGSVNQDCFLDGLHMICNIALILIAVPILIALTKSHAHQVHAQIWVHFPGHTMRWLLLVILVFLNIYEVLEGGIANTLYSSHRLHLFLPDLLKLVGSVVAAAYYHSIEACNSPRFLLLLAPYWLACLLTHVLSVVSLQETFAYLAVRQYFSTTGCIIYSLLILLEGNVWLRLRYAFFKKPVPVQHIDNFEAIKYSHSYASLISKTTFFWVHSILLKGYKQSLHIADLGELPHNESSNLNYKKLQKILREEKNDSGHFSIGWCMWRRVWRLMLIAGVFRLATDLLQLLVPILLIFIINYLEGLPEKQAPLMMKLDALLVDGRSFFSNGYVLLVTMFVSCLLASVFQHAHTHLALTQGLRLKSALQVLVYKKALSLSTWTLTSHQLTSGQLASHMAVDSNNLFLCCYFWHHYWALPLKVLLVLVILYVLLGLGTLAVASILLVMCPLQLLISSHLSHCQQQAQEVGEKRAALMCELLHGIKLLKLQALEDVAMLAIADLRQQQTHRLATAAKLKAASVFITEGTPLLVLMALFGMYPVLEGTQLSAGHACASLVLVDMLVKPLLLMLPLLSHILTNAHHSTKKLDTFLSGHEVQNPRVASLKQKDIVVRFEVGNNGENHVNLQVNPANSHGSRSPATQSPFLGVRGSRSPRSPRSRSPLLGTKNTSGETQGEESLLPGQSSPRLNEGYGGHSPSIDRRVRGHSPVLEQWGLSKISEEGAGAAVKRVAEIEHEPARQISESITDPSFSRKSSSGMSVGGSGLDDTDIAPDRALGIAVQVSNATFSWDPQNTDHCELKEIDFTAPAGELTILTGPQGGGKSCLLAALLGEMHKQSGTVMWKSGTTVTYVGQKPWLRSLSLQDNILSGRAYERRRYRRVILACQLQPDINLLPDRDHTIIGENGIIMSQGQEQRICMARAMYSASDIVIMDDPFSSLDTRTATHLFEDGLLRFMLRRKRTIIISTHVMHFLPLANQIVRLKDGHVTHTGTFVGLKDSDPQLFSQWKELVRKQTSSASPGEADHSCSDSTGSERRVLRRKVSNLEFNRDLPQLLGVLTEDSAVNHTSLGKVLVCPEQPPGTSALPAPAVHYQSQSSHDTDISEVELEEREEALHEVPGPQEVGQDGVTVRAVQAYVAATWRGLAVGLCLLQLARAACVLLADILVVGWTDTPHDVTPLNITQEELSIEVATVGWLGAPFIPAYISVCIVVIVTGFLMAAIAEASGWNTAQNLHGNLLQHVLHLPMRFFDTTTMSQIMTTFTADVDMVDDKLVVTVVTLIRSLLVCVAALTVNVYAMPYFWIPAIGIMVAFFMIQKYFRPTSRDLQRLDSVTKVPILSHLSETLTGLQTIRARREEHKFVKEMMSRIDDNISANLWLSAANHWIGVRTDIVSALVVLSAGLCSITACINGNLAPSYAGLALVYALMMTGHFSWVIRCVVDLDRLMGAVERVVALSYREQELTGGESPPDEWPAFGDVVYHQVSLRYHASLKSVVKRAQLHIPSGSRVGICGKSSSGKSSLALGLFKMLEINEGQIFLDEVDICDVCPHKLRQSLAIVPQEPQLFKASIRKNLDPEEKKNDIDLWKMLEKVQLKDFVKSLPKDIETEISTTSSDLTLSQKQMVCLGRALLRQSKVLVLDEALSCVDESTGLAVMDLLSTLHGHTTVIIIAHHVQTVLHCDVVVVMESGQIVEHSSPATLLTTPGSHLNALLKSHK